MSKVSALSYFPLSVALEKAFCNRVEELARLQEYIENGRPVLLTSPRRYGKTSLALKTLMQTKLPYAHVDFFSCVSEKDIEKVILKAVSKLILQMESLPKKAFVLASELFDSSNLRVSMTKFGLEIDLKKETEKPSFRILEILERLEKLAKKTKKRIVLFFDEFQAITEATSTHAIEAVMRQVAQLTQSISFVFSGSNRRLLSELFEDRKRPFYKLCERLTLDRISESAYTKHIQAIAKQQWSRHLAETELAKIYHYSECHPYYVNLLCSRLLFKDKPTVTNIEKIWVQYAEEEKSHVSSEVELLSRNQKKLLVMLSRLNGAYSPTGKEFLSRCDMSKTSIEQALQILEKKDYVFRANDGHIRVLDPLIKTVLSDI